MWFFQTPLATSFRPKTELLLEMGLSSSTWKRDCQSPNYTAYSGPMCGTTWWEPFLTLPTLISSRSANFVLTSPMSFKNWSRRVVGNAMRSNRPKPLSCSDKNFGNGIPGRPSNSGYLLPTTKRKRSMRSPGPTSLRISASSTEGRSICSSSCTLTRMATARLPSESLVTTLASCQWTNYSGRLSSRTPSPPATS